MYNIQVEEHNTYHVGEFGVWVHNANCCDLANRVAVDPTKRGVISPTKLENNQISIDLTPDQQTRALDIARNGDSGGTKTEALVNDVITSQGGKVLDGAKYGSNNGMDHVAVWTDANGNVNLTLQLDSKQLNSKGVTLAPNAAQGTMQMSPKWDEVVIEKLPIDSPARIAIDTARNNGTLIKGVAYVDKETGALNLTRLNENASSMIGAPSAPVAPTK